MRVADLEFIESNNKSGEETLKLTVVETKGIIQYLTTFGPNDYWYFAGLGGKCDGTWLFQGERDASTELDRKANMVVSMPYPHGFVTDVEILEWMNIYFMHGPLYCCAPDALNEWLDEGKIDADNNKPENKDIIVYDFWHDMTTGSSYGLILDVTYGIWHPSDIIED